MKKQMRRIFNLAGWLFLIVMIVTLPITVVYAVAHTIGVFGPIFFLITIDVLLIERTSSKARLKTYFLPLSMMTISFYLAGIIEMLRNISHHTAGYDDLVLYSIPLFAQILLFVWHFRRTRIRSFYTEN